MDPLPTLSQCISCYGPCHIICDMNREFSSLMLVCWPIYGTWTQMSLLGDFHWTVIFTIPGGLCMVFAHLSSFCLCHDWSGSLVVQQRSAPCTVGCKNPMDISVCCKKKEVGNDQVLKDRCTIIALCLN